MSLTLGTFDGVHLGHQALLSSMKRLAEPITIITFETPPISFFTKNPVPLLTTPPHRIALLKQHGATTVLTLAFTPEIADLPFDTFLLNIRRNIPFTHLVLGKNAAFGKGREGSEDNVRAFAKTIDLEVTYLEKSLSENFPISSERIRKLVTTGKLQEASQLLGRPYSILAPILENGHVKLPEFPFCLPPPDKYSVTILNTQKTAHISEKNVWIENFVPQNSLPIEIVF